MQSRIVVNSQEESLLSTHKVLRNTYFLLGLTMAFSAVVAYISMSLNLPYPNLIVLLVGFYGLLFVTNRLANSAWGILAAFAFTGFMGYTIGPILNMYVARGMEDLIMLAFAGTAIVFFACSAYVLTTKKDMSFLPTASAGIWKKKLATIPNNNTINNEKIAVERKDISFFVVST